MAERQQVGDEGEAVFAMVELITLAGIVAPPYAGVSTDLGRASALPDVADRTLDALYAPPQRRLLKLPNECGQIGFVGSKNVRGQLTQLLVQCSQLFECEVGLQAQTPISLSTSPIALSSPATIWSTSSWVMPRGGPMLMVWPAQRRMSPSWWNFSVRRSPSFISSGK